MLNTIRGNDFKFTVASSLSLLSLKNNRDVHYIGGAEILPAPLEPHEEAIVIDELTQKQSEEAKKMLQETITSGAALRKFAEFVEAQGGNPEYIYHPELFLQAAWKEPVYPKADGYLVGCENQQVGMASLILGGGRVTKDSVIDLTVGIQLNKHLGDDVTTTEPFAYIYGNDRQKIEEAKERLQGAYRIEREYQAPQAVIRSVITEE